MSDGSSGPGPGQLPAITGTHVYTLPGCARRVALDMHGDRALRRDLRAEEELVLARGREHEERFVAGLAAWCEPRYDRADWERGAQQTREFLVAGVPGVLQGVLLGDDRLGIPDLLRREAGASVFGEHHYVVGDVKSSSRPRSDQLLQVVFYAEMLAELQQREPDYVYLVLKDGEERRYDWKPLRAALAEVVERIGELRAEPATTRPFLLRNCEGCRWSEVCLPELREARDLSLVNGMTAGLRSTLEAAGVATVEALAKAVVERLARRTHLEPAMLRRLRRAAEAAVAGQPLRERPGRTAAIHPAAVVHLLTDPFAERTLWIGIARRGERGGEPRIEEVVLPESEDAAFESFCDLVTRVVPAGWSLLHYGRALPDWFERHAVRRRAPWLEERFVDLARRLRGAASWPGPVFGLAEHVAFGLGRDPHRAGRTAAGAWMATQDDGAARLRAKGRADLDDLLELDAVFLAAEDRAVAEAAE